MEPLCGRWIIGDVHGCHRTLLALLALLARIDKSPYRRDGISLVGDLVDRGPGSAAVVQHVIDHKMECVMGNHEAMLLEADAAPGYHDTTYRSYDSDAHLARHLKHIKTHFKPFYCYDIIGHPPLVVSHSCLHNVWKGRDLARYDAMELLSILWERVPYERGRFVGVHEPRARGNAIFNVFGHTHGETVRQTACMANIDTAAAYGGKLTALHYPSMTVVQQGLIDQV